MSGGLDARLSDLQTTLATLFFWLVFIGGSLIAAKRGRKYSRFVRLVLLLLVWFLAFGCLWVTTSTPRALTNYFPAVILLVTFAVWPLARHVLGPLGLVKPAYYLALGAFAKSEERTSNALLAAAIALTRKGEYDPDAAAWLEDKIQSDTAIRGSTIAAAAVAAAARGDKEGARVLFESVRTLDDQVAPRACRGVAGEWLSAEAASRGAWEEVIEIGTDLLATGRGAWFLAGAGKRLLAKSDAPGRSTLVLRWLLAPGRLHTFSILERALSVPDNASPPDDAVDDSPADNPSVPEGDSLARALAAHVRLLRAKKPAPREIAAVGRAFDEALGSPDLTRHVEERGALLGATRAGTVLSLLGDDVEDSLFHLLKHHRIALDDTAIELGDIASRAQRRLRDETLTVIEALSDAVRSRVDEKRALSPIDEWREWTALRIAYERGVLLGGPELRYLAFTKVHSDVCALAVWLFNIRKEKPIANAMFRFLLTEATAVGDAEAITLQTKNVDCGV